KTDGAITLGVIQTADWREYEVPVRLAGFRPSAIAFAPTGASIYLAGPGVRNMVVARYDRGSLRLLDSWAFPWPRGRTDGSVVALTVSASERSLYISYDTGTDRVDLAGGRATLCRAAGDPACVASVGPALPVDDVVVSALPTPAGTYPASVGPSAGGGRIQASGTDRADSIDTGLGRFLARRKGDPAVPVLGADSAGRRVFVSVPCERDTLSPQIASSELTPPVPDTSVSPGLLVVTLPGASAPAQSRLKPSLLTARISCADQISVSTFGDWVGIEQRDIESGVHSLPTGDHRWTQSWVTVLDSRTGAAMRSIEMHETIVDIWCCVAGGARRPP
ncbi:MAG TPA: hypothetical protein VMH39_08105, partial [Gemmatimonadaceae bacterium]|nr:hypothetical protein [Gemmatimonadaceae bacterium]